MTGETMDYDIKDMELADKGKLKIEWASMQMPEMPVLQLIKERFEKEAFMTLRVTHEDENRLA